MRLNIQRRRGGRAFLMLLIGLLLGGAAGAGAVFLLKREKGGIPGNPRLGHVDELALVPPDCVAFVHLRARDLWNSETLVELRKLIEKAGPDALKSLDEGFAPAPSTLDRVTLIVFGQTTPHAIQTPPKGKSGPPQPKGGPEPKFLPQPPPPKGLLDFPDKIDVVGLLAFTAEFEEEKVRASLLPNAVSKTSNGKNYWTDPARGLGIYFPSKTMMAIGSPDGVTQFVNRQPVEGKFPEGPLSGAIERAASGKYQLMAAVNAQQFHLNLQQITNDVRSLPVNMDDLPTLAEQAKAFLHADAFGLGIGLMGHDDSKLDLYAYYKNDTEAEEGEKALRAMAELAHKKLAEPKKKLEEDLKGSPDHKKPRQIEDLTKAVVALLGLGIMNKIDDYLVNPPLRRDGKELVASFETSSLGSMYVGGVAMAVGGIAAILMPGSQKMAMAPERMVSSTNLKRIGIAMLSYEVAQNHFPMSAPNENEKAQLSWRVHLLPFLGEQDLYNEFNTDEPWDSANNKKLIDRMPKVYQSPLAFAPPGQTFYKVFSGGGAVFAPGQKTRLTDITDGTANTILVVEGGSPVIWTKPEDISFDPNKKLADLSLQGNRQINVLMVDGDVRSLNLNQVSEKTLKAAITMAGNEVLGKDWDK